MSVCVCVLFNWTAERLDVYHVGCALHWLDLGVDELYEMVRIALDKLLALAAKYRTSKYAGKLREAGYTYA